MKTYSSILGLIILATVAPAVRGAEAGARPVEKHVVVAGETRAGRDEKAREPVTFLGVAVTPAEPALTAQLRLPEGQGLVVMTVEADSPAAKAGLMQHDVLRKLDDQILIDPRQLSVLVRSHKDGEAITITYLRAGAEAKAAVTLATHLLVAENGARWPGADAPDVFFRTENFSHAFGEATPEAGDVRMFSPGVTMAPNAPMPATARHGGGMPGSRVMIYHPETNVVFSDDAGTLMVRFDGKSQVLTAKNPKGEVVFEGPVATAEQRAALPEELRKRYEKLQSLNVFETPTPAPAPPSPPPSAFVPVEPARAAPLL